MGTDQDSTGRVDFTRIGVELFGTGETTPESAEQRAAEYAPGYEVTRLLMTGAQAVTVEFDGGITARYSPKPPEPEPEVAPPVTPPFLVQVDDAGGGRVSGWVDRSTMQYPKLGEWLRCEPASEADIDAAADEQPLPVREPEVAPVWSLERILNQLHHLTGTRQWMFNQIDHDLGEWFNTAIALKGGRTPSVAVTRSEIAAILLDKFVDHLKELPL